MTVESTLEKLSSSLPEWSYKGLNEAQTSQVIVLQVFQALGYDIWNPFEVVAQFHSGGGSGAYAPDFTVYLPKGNCFVVEVKALEKDFSVNDRMQPVNYVNALGRRWAVLTNGKAWHFYDNKIEKPAAEKLALTVDLQAARAADYLKRLLSREVWSKAEAEYTLATEVQRISQEIRKHLQLGKIEDKLRDEMKTGLTADENGLTKAIKLALEPNERELAEESFAELAQKLLGIDTPPVKLNREPKPEPTGQAAASAIIEGIRRTTLNQRGNRSSELQAWLGETKLPATNWRDINSGIVEAMLALGRKTFVEDKGYIFSTNQSRVKGNGELYPTSAYRQLSDGSFLFLNESASSHMQKSRRMLEELEIPPRTLRVCYREDTFYLP